MRIFAGLALSALLSFAAQGQEFLPPGRYCGVINLNRLGLEIYPRQADGRIRAAVSWITNQEDWGGTTRHTTMPIYHVITHKWPLDGVIANDRTVQLNNGTRYSFTGLRFQTGVITGVGTAATDKLSPPTLEIVRGLMQKSAVCCSTSRAPE